jgi:very-short-patch-repair endonuclease
MGSFRTGSRKTNEAEARLVVALLTASAQHPAYKDKSFGAIALLGDDQAELISRLALEHLGAVELESRRFHSGNAAQFQGDERDVMFLSMVDSPIDGVLRMVQDDSVKQRYNVAASRAKDQMWLVHSLNPDQDLQQGDIRRRLIEHVRNPRALAALVARIQRRAESPLEKAVIQQLVYAGYDVKPQVWVGRYRVDMVVRSKGVQVIVECDGDRYHGFEKIAEDLARQAVLERVGWRFVRVRGTRYFRDPKGAMAEVFARLRALGVMPVVGTASTVTAPPPSSLRDDVIRSAWEIMRKNGWIHETPTPVDEPVSWIDSADAEPMKM